MADLNKDRTPDAISRRALTLQLQRKKCGVSDKRYTEGFNDAILRVRSMVHAAPSLGSYVRWISVKDRQPAPFVSVQVYMPGEAPCPTVREGFVTEEGVWHAGLYDREPGEVTHWTEMAKPPEVQG